jgi:hypothetical protein
MTVDLLSELSAAQAFVLGSTLAVAGVAKIRIGAEPRQVARLAISSVLARVGTAPRYQARAWQALGALELLLAGLLLTGRFLTAARPVALCVFGAGTCYVLWALRNAPDSSCGCFSAHSRITIFTVCRCCVLLASSIFALQARVAWWSALGHTGLAAGAICAELAVLLALSASDLRKVTRLGRARARHFRLGVRALFCHLTADRYLRTKACPAIGLEGVLDRLGRPTDRWRDQCFYFVAYEPARSDQGPTLVAAFHLPGSPYFRRLVSIDHATAQTTVLFDTADVGERPALLQINVGAT